MSPPNRPVRIVLASASPRRRQLLQELGIAFDNFEATIQEEWNDDVDARRIAGRLAKQKAREYPEKDALVIGMDTLVVAGKEKLGKPRDEIEAARMLRSLSNRMHRVITGLCLILNNQTAVSWETTKVFFREISEAEIEWYLKTREPYDKAGGYAIQGFGRLFVRKIDGCFYNVVGFPVYCFQRTLHKLGLDIYDFVNQQSAVERRSL